MANALYQLGIQRYLTGGGDWLTDSNQIAFVTSSYSPNTASDQYLGVAVSSGYIVAQSGNLGSAAASAGVANAANETVSSVSGSTFAYVLGYAFITSNALSPLLFKIDTVTSGLPCTPNGGNIVMQWDTGTNKIFALNREVDYIGRGAWATIRDGLRMIADRTYTGRLWVGTPALVQLTPTDEQATAHACWLERQAKAREIESKFGDRIPRIA
jgi:hypothetical protein